MHTTIHCISSFRSGVWWYPAPPIFFLFSQAKQQQKTTECVRERENKENRRQYIDTNHRLLLQTKPNKQKIPWFLPLRENQVNANTETHKGDQQQQKFTETFGQTHWSSSVSTAVTNYFLILSVEIWQVQFLPPFCLYLCLFFIKNKTLCTC